MRTQSSRPPILTESPSIAIELPFDAPATLACGAWLKNTVCLISGRTAYVSPLLGDLDSADACQAYTDTITRLIATVGTRPECIAHDLHPDFYSTQFAHYYANQHNLPVIAVQHHHAHIGALCAEHGITQAVIGIALDGVGLGTDHTPWGGELLYSAGATFERIGHLQPLAMPGGDRAAREPWRMAAAALHHLGRVDEIMRRFPDQSAAGTVTTMLQQKLHCPSTSSMGRLFDAAAGLLNIAPVQAHEAQAAIKLQNLASEYGHLSAPLSQGHQIHKDNILDFTPLISWLSNQHDTRHAAAVFHATLAAGLAEWAVLAARQHQLSHIALGGGCFHNKLLSQQLVNLLTRQGLKVLSAERLLPDDSAISLGQAWIAAHHMKTFNKHARTY
ncbi:carbamoyltransferase HypF [Nitrosomonas halophila]|uniref:Hydrogenase maturation protein HypF n=1 Tax=Nitrosomonas halophila TaxID=44576 RepID=A0A1H3GPR9_9PROT|nr:carbamoyltransferase HypF [Nitrosomonas halophila]SDY05291.1 hydrogenase maturation protein HypF [Nitrosomonas halophila]